MVSEISVIIPAYNRASLIGETLRSLLNQTVPAKEIIVVDDGSTDGTAERTLEAFEDWKLETGNWKKDGRDQFSGNSKSNIQNPTLKILRQQNSGPGAARNRGFAESTGEFIHFFDSDDIAAPNKHEVQLRALLETGADIAYGQWVKGRFLPAEKLKDFLTTKDAKKHEKAEEVSTTDETDIHGYQKNQHGNAQGTCAIEAFSNPSTSVLVRDSEKISPSRSASAPADALRADHTGLGSAGGNQLADSKDFLEGQSQAGLQMDNQKDPTIRTANDSCASGEYSSSVLIRDIRGSNFSLPRNFVPEGPVLQARGLPKGDLVRALLTNWSIVPHACLFRRSILEKAGGFPEDIWVGEDQLLFLRCLLAGAKVVHTPETLVFYRMGDDPGKLTATGAAQKRHARDWAKFLVKANREVTSGELRVASESRRIPAEAQGRGDFLTTDHTDKHGYQKNQNGNAQGTCAGAAFSNPYTSELARDSESTSPTRSATGPAEALRADDIGTESAGGNQLADSKEFFSGQSQAGLQMDKQKSSAFRNANDPSASGENSSSVPIRDIRGSNSATLDSSTPPAEWYGFRLRAYEAWRDLEKFFPDEEDELENELQGIWTRNWFSGFRFQVSGFVFRKLGGVKLRIMGYREHASFKCGRPSEVGLPPHESQRR
jgi:GT2 family glycosyltransferase